MSKDYFVMLYHPSDDVGYLPLMINDYDIAKFETYEEADKAGRDNTLGESFGYEIFCIGCGE